MSENANQILPGRVTAQTKWLTGILGNRVFRDLQNGIYELLVAPIQLRVGTVDGPDSLRRDSQGGDADAPKP